MPKKRKTKNEFVEDAIKVHGSKYSYDNFSYVNNKTAGYVTCPIHGDFLVRPDKHLWQKRGCPKCNGGVRLTTEEFISRAKKIHGDKYDYSKVDYVNATTPVEIVCMLHGSFMQKPTMHLNGKGCQICGGSLPLTTEEFVERARKIHGDKYDYSKVEYINSQTKVCIICPEHGEFWQIAGHHLNGVGCPICKESHLERDVSINLSRNNVLFDRQKKFKWLCKQSLDFYLPECNIAIECQGVQHFKPCRFGGITKDESIDRFNYLKELDKRKKQLCEENNVNIEYVNYNENVENRINEILTKYKVIGNDLGR